MMRVFLIVATMVGLIFLVIGLTDPGDEFVAFASISAAVLAFPILVSCMVYFIGVGKRARARRIFRDGVAADGVVISVHPYLAYFQPELRFLITYAFRSADGRSRSAVVKLTGGALSTVSPGERIVVLCDSRRPSRHVRWTPIHELLKPREDTPMAQVPMLRVSHEERGDRAATTEDVATEPSEARTKINA